MSFENRMPKMRNLACAFFLRSATPTWICLRSHFRFFRGFIVHVFVHVFVLDMPF